MVWDEVHRTVTGRSFFSNFDRRTESLDPIGAKGYSELPGWWRSGVAAAMTTLEDLDDAGLASDESLFGRREMPRLSDVPWNRRARRRFRWRATACVEQASSGDALKSQRCRPGVARRKCVSMRSNNNGSAITSTSPNALW